MCLGVPGLLAERLGGDGAAACGIVEFAGLRRRVWLGCVPDAVAGDYVVVHAGVAISKIDAEAAARLLEQLRVMAEDDGWRPAAEEASDEVRR